MPLPQDRSWRAECTWVTEQFFRYFEERGYRRHPAEPLLPQNDDSLLFTNSFIVALKPLIRSGAIHPEERLVIEQPCLRTQNLNRDPVDPSPLAYSSRFDMIGGLVGREVLSGMLLDLHALFVDVLGVPAERLVVKASRETPFFLRHVSSSPWGKGTLVDSEPERYYRWGYGEPGLTGRGVTFALRAPSTGHLRDFGNIVELVYHDWVGYEFGFGVETFVCRLHDLRAPVEASRLTELMPHWNSPHYDLTKDLITIAHTLFCEGIRAGKGGPRHILKKTCRALARQFEVGVLDATELQVALSRLGGLEPEAFFTMFERQLELFRQQRGLAHASTSKERRSNG